uniref:uncharacterized protein LOC113475197 n=1 Tax=Ciona intestinalis TaxID=7719 RepID=UPI000EF4931C|nr:uncharacterized protein LOC113475197 [Ciona intestinalis]|eukprot:XP_026694865.1 uncharacterized protein LOC113475197 [Ciona intestinalis]
MANQVGHVTPCCNCGHVCTTSQCGRFTSSECAERRTSYNPVFTLTPPFSRLSNTSVSSGLSSVFTESPKCRRCLNNDMEGPVSNGDGSKRERYDHDECVFNLDSSMQTFRHSLPTRCQRCSKSTPTKLRCSFAHSEPGFLPVDLLRFGGESLRNPSVSMNSSRSGIFFTTDSSLDNKAKVDFSTWGAPGRCIYMGQKEMNVYDMTVVGNCIVASDADKVKVGDITKNVPTYICRVIYSRVGGDGTSLAHNIQMS